MIQLGHSAGKMVLVLKRFSFRNLAKTGRRFAVRCVIGFLLLAEIPLAGQNTQSPSITNGRYGQAYPDPGTPFGQESNGPDPKRIKSLNAERQKTLVSDTEKLLKLARELNDEMAAIDSGTMNGEQLHKLEEIRKLARSVKEKMSFNVVGFPSINAPLTNQPGIQ